MTLADLAASERLRAGGGGAPTDGGAPTGASVMQRAVLARAISYGFASGARILDAPCGAGALSADLGSAGFRVSALDVDPRARDVLGDAFQQADLEHALPFPDGLMDAVFSVEGIEHLENAFGFLREAWRVLRPGGILILTTPNTPNVRSRVRYLGSGFFHHDPRPLREAARDPMHHIGLRTFPELRYALVTSGFCLREVAHTHVKAVSLMYAPYVPWIAAYTAIAFRKEKTLEQRRVNGAIRRSLLSYSLLFGENLLLAAEKVPASG